MKANEASSDTALRKLMWDVTEDWHAVYGCHLIVIFYHPFPYESRLPLVSSCSYIADTHGGSVGLMLKAAVDWQDRDCPRFAAGHDPCQPPAENIEGK